MCEIQRRDCAFPMVRVLARISKLPVQPSDDSKTKTIFIKYVDIFAVFGVVSAEECP